MIKKEIKIGVFVLVMLAILGWGLNYLKGRDVFFRGNLYYGIYPKVDGLTDASPVYYKGFKVGAVRDIEIEASETQRFIVSFALTKDIFLPKNSVAQIYSLDLLGSKGVQFIPGNSHEPLMPNDTLGTSIIGDLADQLSTNVLPLKDKTERLITRFDSVLANIGRLVDEDNIAHLSGSFHSLHQSLQHMEVVTQNLALYTGPNGGMGSVTQKLDSLLGRLNAQGNHIDTTMDGLSAMAQDLKNARIDQTFLELKNTLSQTTLALKSINESQGSMGLLLNDKQLYYSLQDASANLNRLLIDLRQNPKRYVNLSAVSFGSKSGNLPSTEMEGMVFQIQLFVAYAPQMPENRTLCNRLIQEDYDGKKFVYTLGNLRNYEEAQQLLLQVKPHYPNSVLIALENGQYISVKKALKKLR